MILLITGGSGSGKSAYGERRAVELAKRGKSAQSAKPGEHIGTAQSAEAPPGRLLYLATMKVGDEESRRRVARHRNMRAGKGFVTVECQTHLEHVEVLAGDTVLLECISNLTANEMYGPNGRGEDTI